MKKYYISPSILSADFAVLDQEIKKVIDNGADSIHFDAMDNNFVPNLTIGPDICKAIRKHNPDLIIDVHLMLENVDNIIPSFAQSGATSITIHPESTKHLDRSLQLIHTCGVKAGLAFSPATSLNHLKYVLDKIDIILIMSVNPGFGGQKFIPGSIHKINEAYNLIKVNGKNIQLAVDGGINLDNITDIAKAGADTFVVGNTIFSSSDYGKTINALRDKLPKN